MSSGPLRPGDVSLELEGHDSTGVAMFLFLKHIQGQLESAKMFPVLGHIVGTAAAEEEFLEWHHIIEHL